MVRFLSKAAFGLAAFVALPSAAQAGTTTASATVTMQVASQCALTGANVHLGSFKTTDTWLTVGAKHGYLLSFTYTPGSAGQESLNFGSVTCDAGLPWTLLIRGTNSASGSSGGIKLTLNGKVAVMYPAIKRVGGVVMSDVGPMSFAGTGAQVWASSASSTGKGVAQTLLGNVTLSFNTAHGTTVTSGTAMGNVGSATDTLTYTLTF